MKSGMLNHSIRSIRLLKMSDKLPACRGQAGEIADGNQRQAGSLSDTRVVFSSGVVNHRFMIAV